MGLGFRTGKILSPHVVHTLGTMLRAETPQLSGSTFEARMEQPLVCAVCSPPYWGALGRELEDPPPSSPVEE